MFDFLNQITLDHFAQFIIMTVGLAALIFLTLNKPKWGFLLGLISQPFWFITTYQNKQWPIFALNFGYLLTWSYGVWKHWIKQSPPILIRESARANFTIIRRRLSHANESPCQLEVNGDLTADELMGLGLLLKEFEGPPSLKLQCYNFRLVIRQSCVQ